MELIFTLFGIGQNLTDLDYLAINGAVIMSGVIVTIIYNFWIK